MKIDKALQSAHQYYQAGDLNQARDIYKKILKVKPNNIDALHFLGIICCQLGNYDDAIRYIKEEIRLTPSNADAYNNLGLVLQAKGLRSEAIGCFRKAVALNPLSPQANYNLGFAFQNAGQFDEAIHNYQKAVQIEPGLVEAYNNLGILLRARGRPDEAITYFQKAIQINPKYANTYNNLGLSLQDKGDIDKSIANYKKAIHLNPDFADAYYNLAIASEGKKQVEEAVGFYKKALQLDPNYTSALNNLGNLYLGKKQLDEAVDCYQKALKLKPDFFDAYNNLGIILQEKGQIDEAIINFQKALQINPDVAKVHINLGTAFLKKDELEKAMICFQKALHMKTDFIDAYNKIGFVLQNIGQPEKAIQYFQKAVQIDPDHVDSHFGLSFPLLLSGNFEQGWREYEWRRKTEDFVSNLPDFSQPLWDGSDISGKTILLHAEQGLGDVIQFIRYVPLVAEKGARVIIECQHQLISLFQNIEGAEPFTAPGEPLPSFDFHCPLLSLPLVFGTTVDTIPAEIPYIKVNAALLRKWADKVENDNSKLRVGLAWAGNPAHKNDRKRSFPLNTFKPLAQFNAMVFYSLQKGNGSEQAKNPPDMMKFIDYTDEIHDFSDTAALIMNLDLVISADTAVAHLAGALGKPVWTLIPFAPDWRWMLNREDSPWYPTMRLFRQPAPGDWQTVIDNVSKTLKELVIEREHR